MSAEAFRPLLERPSGHHQSEYLPTDAEWSEFADVAAALSADGYAWHSLGRRWSKAADGTVRVWLNGSYVMGSQHLSRQPFGWFTVDELRREVFASDCR